MDGCISYPSLGSIRVSMISMPSNSSSYPTSYPRQRQGNKTKRRTRRQRRRERGYRVVFRHQTQQHFLVSFDGSAEIPRHDQLHSPQLQVSEGVRLRGDERSFPVQVYGPSGEARRHRTSTERGLLQSTEERRYFRRGIRRLSRGLARQRHDDFPRLSRLVQQ